ncbi:MAG: hypothetical protein ACXWKG_10170 [Limisphaerales bacterium]
MPIVPAFISKNIRPRIKGWRTPTGKGRLQTGAPSGHIGQSLIILQ